MKHIIQKLILLTALLSTVFFTGVANAQAFWEIPDPYFKYIAMVRAHPQWEYAVIYNPVMCEQIGDACAFFRAHEYSHGFRNDIFLRPDEYPQSLEDRADCWAAKYIHSNEVEAIINLLSDSEAIKDLPIYGDPAHRVEIIRKCAEEGGVWIGRKKH